MTMTYTTVNTLSKANVVEHVRLRKRVKALESELEDLRENHRGLIGDIIDNKVDYAEILEIRNVYYKRIASAPMKKYADPVAKLELYKRLTKKYHNEFVASRFIYVGHEDIAPLRRAENLIASITYRLIDLSNVEKNAFVISMKRVRQIQHELINFPL